MIPEGRPSTFGTNRIQAFIARLFSKPFSECFDKKCFQKVEMLIPVVLARRKQVQSHSVFHNFANVVAFLSVSFAHLAKCANL